jgi:hypothetical protein
MSGAFIVYGPRPRSNRTQGDGVMTASARSARHAHQRLPQRARVSPSAIPGASEKPSGANTMIVEPCSNQPSSCPLSAASVAGDLVGPAVAQVQAHVRERQPDAGHEHRGNRHHRDPTGRHPSDVR